MAYGFWVFVSKEFDYIATHKVVRLEDKPIMASVFLDLQKNVSL